MTTLQSVELRCPVCDWTFRSYTAPPAITPGRKRTDFHERAAGVQPLAFKVHMCGRCGYAGAEEDFGAEDEVGYLVRDHVWNELAPNLPLAALTGDVPGSEKYEAAAKIAEWQSAEPERVGVAWLHAAWCCVEEGDVEAERYFRRKAAWAFEEALESYDGVPPRERAMWTYLVGELWRRVGDVKRAAAWFDRVPDEVVDRENQQWLLVAARQQRDCPREWFD